MENKLKDKVAVVTGAGGTLCSAMAIDLAKKGCKVAVLDLNLQNAQKIVDEITALGGTAMAASCDVTNEEQVQNVSQLVYDAYGAFNILINGAGGNQADAVTSINEYQPEEMEGNVEGLRGFFNLSMKRFHDVVTVNTMGTVIPCFVFAKVMAENGGGSIVNFASMNAYRPLSRVPAYALSKAGIANFTQWLAAYLAPAGIRVNAIAPGFFLNDRSRKIMFNEDGSHTARANNVLGNTPMKRFGEAPDLLGTMNWLVDQDASAFVTGITIPVDGGFLSCAGV